MEDKPAKKAGAEEEESASSRSHAKALKQEEGTSQESIGQEGAGTLGSHHCPRNSGRVHDLRQWPFS